MRSLKGKVSKRNCNGINRLWDSPNHQKFSINLSGQCSRHPWQVFTQDPFLIWNIGHCVNVFLGKTLYFRSASLHRELLELIL